MGPRPRYPSLPAGNNLLSSTDSFTWGPGPLLSSRKAPRILCVDGHYHTGAQRWVLLTGVLDLLSFTQTGSTGSTNTTLLANLDIPGGNYCPPSGTGTCGLGSGLVTDLSVGE